MGDDQLPDAVAAMSAEEFADFVEQMYWLVQEQGHLWEAPLGAIDRLVSGDVRHGPWPQEACAVVLMAWHSAGLLGLYEDTPNGPKDLEQSKVRWLLTGTERWSPDTTPFMLFATSAAEREDAGAREAVARWRAAISLGADPKES